MCSVTVRLLGGLGNQMFQYAAALSLANRHEMQLKIDLSAFDTYKTWPYQLDCLQLPQNLCFDKPAPRQQMSNGMLARLGRRVISRPSEGVYHEPHFHFDENLLNMGCQNVVLEGYFQSPRYFQGVEDRLREQYQLSSDWSSIGQIWLDKINASPCSIALHVRRGDYLSAGASGTHSSLNLDYYRRSIDLMRKLLGQEIQFFLFSDDAEFVESTFSDLASAQVVTSNPDAPWEDMFLMAHCRHNIIANSSYSWWGAWLNPNPEKYVIAPAQWFTPAKMAVCNVLDLYPDDWIILK